VTLGVDVFSIRHLFQRFLPAVTTYKINADTKGIDYQKVSKTQTSAVKDDPPSLGTPSQGWMPKSHLIKVIAQLDRETKQKRAANGNI
jgi:hypothetical protein